jgi:hypothetical protein
MSNHIANAAVQTTSCGALRNLAMTSGYWVHFFTLLWLRSHSYCLASTENNIQFGRFDVHAMVIRAMHTHTMEPSVQVQACGKKKNRFFFFSLSFVIYLVFIFRCFGKSFSEPRYLLFAYLANLLRDFMAAMFAILMFIFQKIVSCLWEQIFINLSPRPWITTNRFALFRSTDVAF